MPGPQLVPRTQDQVGPARVGAAAILLGGSGRAVRVRVPDPHELKARGARPLVRAQKICGRDLEASRARLGRDVGGGADPGDLVGVASALALLFNQGEAIEPNPWFSLYLLLTLFTFYAWFWNKSGQTLGMRVWKIRIVSESGGNPDWATCYLRLVSALLSLLCLGLGYWWRLFKPYTWHDRLSKTSIIDVSTVSPAKQ